MDGDGGNPRLGGGRHHRLQLQFVAVDPTWREQAQHVQRRAILPGAGDGFSQRRIARKLAVLDGEFDPRVVLVDDPSRPDIEVADIRVAHLTGRQAYVQFRSLDQRMREVRPQAVPVRRIGEFDRIVRRGVAVAETVEDDQQDRGNRRSGSGHGNRGGRPSWEGELRIKLSFYFALTFGLRPATGHSCNCSNS